MKDAFIKSLPKKNQLKLLQERETTTFQDLFEKYTQQLMLENLLPENDVVAAFNHVAPPSLSESDRDTSEILQEWEETKKTNKQKGQSNKKQYIRSAGTQQKP